MIHSKSSRYALLALAFGMAQAAIESPLTAQTPPGFVCSWDQTNDGAPKGGYTISSGSSVG